MRWAVALQYIYKGPDRASVRAEGEWNRDEIKVYEDMRYFGSSEACWRLFSFNMFSIKPPVKRLPLHLDGHQYRTYREGSEEAAANEDEPDTALLQWLLYCQQPEFAARRPLPPNWTELTYLTFPGYFVFKRENAAYRWLPNDMRESHRYRTVGRLPTVSMHDEEQFYLRMLLCTLTCGEVQAMSATTVAGLKGASATFKEACIARGLASDDREWEYALAEAVGYQFPAQVREMFLWILVFNSPVNPHALFEQFWESFIDTRHEPYASMQTHADRLGCDRNVLDRLFTIIDLTDALEATGLSLHEAQQRLPTIDSNQQLLIEQIHDFNREPRVLQHEMDFNHRTERQQVQQSNVLIAQQESQKEAFDAVQDCYIHNDPARTSKVFFFDAPAGSGKTFLLQALLHMVRADGEIAIAVASTGITALQLDKGGTVHSKLKAPLFVTPDSSLNISAQSAIAKVICRAKLLVYEEAVMHNVDLLNAVDKTFKDMRQDWDRPFGGMIVVMAGDL